MHEATSAGSPSSGQTSSAGKAIVVVSLNATMLCSVLPPELVLHDAVLHDGRAPVDALLVDGIAAASLVQAAAIVPDHDVADPPLVLVLRRGRDHVGRELPDRPLA